MFYLFGIWILWFNYAAMIYIQGSWQKKNLLLPSASKKKKSCPKKKDVFPGSRDWVTLLIKCVFPSFCMVSILNVRKLQRAHSCKNFLSRCCSVSSSLIELSRVIQILGAGVCAPCRHHSACWNININVTFMKCKINYFLLVWSELKWNYLQFYEKNA